MRIKITLGNVCLEIEDNETATNNYCMAGHESTVKRTIELTRSLANEVIKMNNNLFGDKNEKNNT